MSKHASLTPSLLGNMTPPNEPLSPEMQAFFDDYAASPEAARDGYADVPPPQPRRSPASAAPPPPEGPADKLDFTPVPVKPRKDGWTAYRQRIFIRTLADTCPVHDACEAAGVDPRSAYRLRRRPGAESFDRAWRNALQFGINRLTAIAFERAVTGTPRAVWHKGERVGHDYVPSERLLIFLLTHYDRMRFGNLSGFLPCSVPDPVDEARGDLPALLDELVDHPITLDPATSEGFVILWDEE